MVALIMSHWDVERNVLVDDGECYAPGCMNPVWLRQRRMQPALYCKEHMEQFYEQATRFAESPRRAERPTGLSKRQLGRKHERSRKTPAREVPEAEPRRKVSRA